MITIAVPQMGNDLFRRYMKGKYVRSLSRAGAAVRWIELSDPDAAAKEAVSCDGLLLPGGADIDPSRYGQTPQPECGKPNELRDAAEFVMLDAFYRTGKPVLGICRGIQVMNVQAGGTLFQDIKGTSVCRHMDFRSRNRSIHRVTVAEGSLLARITGSGEHDVNSLHHQAADRIGDGFTVSAVSEDGFTEAIERSDHAFCLGVQWHPEHMSRRSLDQRQIFAAFVQACRTYAAFLNMTPQQRDRS